MLSPDRRPTGRRLSWQTIGAAADRILRMPERGSQLGPFILPWSIDPDAARARGLTLTHDGREYVFCGKGCLLEFRDDPSTFVDPTHLPTM
jgi:hypothetical protein